MLVCLSEGLGDKHKKKGAEGTRPSIVLLLLDCFYHLFRSETVEEMFAGGAMLLGTKKEAEGEKPVVVSEKEIIAMRLRQHAKKQGLENTRLAKSLPSRHSRFGTMITQATP